MEIRNSYPPEITNDDRADWAVEGLRAFGSATGQVDYDYGDPEQVYEVAGDLICDLLHLGVRVGVDPERLLAMGRGHFDDETDGAN